MNYGYCNRHGFNLTKAETKFRGCEDGQGCLAFKHYDDGFTDKAKASEEKGTMIKLPKKIRSKGRIPMFKFMEKVSKND